MNQQLSCGALSVDPALSVSPTPPQVAKRTFDRVISRAPTMRQPFPLRNEELAPVSLELQFAALRAAYETAGGIARGADLDRLLADHPSDEFLSLPRLMVLGAVFGFELESTLWVPMFQFDLRDMSVRRAVRPVLDELASAFDGWRLAVWFVQPNAWLRNRRPVDLLESSLTVVVDAARADRFVAIG